MADKKSDKAPIIIIKKKRHAGHGHHGGAWKVAYADFVTAMMAFFLVMWLMGADEETLASIESYFKNPGAAVPLSFKGVDPRGGSQMDVFQEPAKKGGRVLDMPAGKTNSSDNDSSQLLEIKEILEDALTLELGMTSLAKDIILAREPQGIVLKIVVKDLYEAGTSDIRQDYVPLIDRVGKVLSRSPAYIRIEGHADPGETPRKSESLWTLSSDRASWVAQYWLEKFKGTLDPSRIQVGANAGLRPIERSNTPHGRAANRRIEIVVVGLPKDQ